jgi:hypothetical protein
MTSAKISAGVYEVLGTSTACQLFSGATGVHHRPLWFLYSDGKVVTAFLSKRAALVYCQEHPEL